MNSTRKFKKDYRNVLVLPKLTFPEEKVLRLEISETRLADVWWYSPSNMRTFSMRTASTRTFWTVPTITPTIILIIP